MYILKNENAGPVFLSRESVHGMGGPGNAYALIQLPRVPRVSPGLAYPGFLFARHAIPPVVSIPSNLPRELHRWQQNHKPADSLQHRQLHWLSPVQLDRRHRARRRFGTSVADRTEILVVPVEHCFRFVWGSCAG